MLLNSLLIKTTIQTETIVFIQHISYLNWLKSKNLHLHSRRTVASITGKLKSHLWKISAFKLKVSVSDHNLILDHICQHRTVSSLLFSKTKQQPHPSLCVVPTCINPHLSVHPRYVSDLDIIWSFELGCNLWCCGLGGLSHSDRCCCTATPASRRRPNWGQTQDRVKIYALMLHTRQGLLYTT